jgi:hypothetical protein
MFLDLRQIVDALMDKRRQMGDNSAVRPSYALFPAKICFKSQF